MAGNTSFKSPININLAQQPQTTNSELYRELSIIYNAIRILQQGVTTLTGAQTPDASTFNQIQYGDSLIAGNLNRMYCKADVAMTYGTIVSLVADGLGGVKAVKSRAGVIANLIRGIGWMNILAGCAAGDEVEIIVNNGLLPGLSGLLPGSTYYLSATVGTITSVKPTLATDVVQYVGIALTNSILLVNFGTPTKADSSF